MLGDIVRGAGLVVGPAGSGKTTTLCRAYVDLVRAGEKGLLFLVHSRRTARALSDRLLREIGSSTDQVRVTTWHAFALSLLRAHHARLGYRREPGLLTGPEQFTLVREMLGAPEEQQLWGEHRRVLRLNGFVEELREFVLRAQDALEEPEALAERARAAGRPELEQAALFFRRYLDVLDAQDLVDHANVIALAVKLLQEHEDVAASVREESRHLFADDYQDVTPAQQTLFRLLFGGGSVTVAADPEARIFGFRGASADALETYRATFPPVREITLSEQHRRPEPPRALLFDHLTQEADWIARTCKRLHAREGVAWGSVAIVVRRYGGAARAIRRALRREGVPYVVVGENRPLAAEPVLKPMLDLARAAIRPEQREELLPGLLASPAVGLDPYDVRALRREARLRRANLTELLAAAPEDLPERLRAALLSLASLLEEVASNNDHMRPDELFWFLWSRCDYFRSVVDRADADDLDAIAAFSRAIERFSERRPDMRFSDYLQALEGVEFGPEPWRMPEDRRPDAVRVMTAHHAAGMEFETVFVAGCVEGEFPDLRERRAMIDIRELLAPASPLERKRARLAEERRLFGVATSRARRAVSLTAARESSQREALVPSPFVAHGWDRPDAADEPITLEDAEAAWRRLARAQTEPESERRAAVRALASLPGLDTSRWWYERDWTHNPAPLIGEEFRTSYSRLSPYENCGLQYLYQVELGLDPDQTHHMLMGSWIHDIVDRCARGEIECTEEALIGELRKLWRPGAFPNAAIEHRARVSCEDMLRRWLAAEAPRKPLATEVEFNFPLDGAILRGYIDRVTRCGTKSVQLTDYKTSQSYKSEEETREDLQLATYYLAMRRDPNLASLGEPMMLELAFLAKPRAQTGFVRQAFDPRRIEDYEEHAEQRLLALIEGVRSEEFSPRADANCMFCRFKPLCPVWPEGDEVKL